MDFSKNVCAVISVINYCQNVEFFVTFSAEVWFRHGAQGLVKILKLKFGQYFEAGAYLRFDNFWKYNWEQR